MATFEYWMWEIVVMILICCVVLTVVRLVNDLDERFSTEHMSKGRRKLLQGRITASLIFLFLESLTVICINFMLAKGNV